MRMTAHRKRLLTGLQPSGQLHVGNYLGALKPFIELYPRYDSMLMVADYHALTSLKDSNQLHRNILDIVKDYVAAGVDPTQTTIFQQSGIPEHTELAWIFECLVSMPFLMQAHAYKDKISKGSDINAGLFNYPMLMAADILLYDTDIVPVGQDQRQHVEYAREAANKFNIAYGETFTAPQEHILGGVGTVVGTDGKKMSKSYHNTIPLFGTDDEIRKAIMSITTDSTPAGAPLDPDTDIVFSLHRHFAADIDTLEARYREGSIGYKESKELLAQHIIDTVAPLRYKRESLSDEMVRDILVEGTNKARALASEKMRDVRIKVGVSLTV